MQLLRQNMSRRYTAGIQEEATLRPELHDTGLLPERHEVKTLPSLVWS